MLSHKILTRQDVGRAASYYEDSADDYYAKDGSSSEWQGEGAKTLKLKGVVDSEKFRKLLAGDTNLSQRRSGNSNDNSSNHDSRAARASTRQDSNNRIGIDFTFSAPKSLSMQALVAIDGNIIKAHDKAVKQALKIAETKAEARKKIKGKSYVEKTKNLVIAKFRHETSRERDPQLHTHGIIMNLTKREDGKWCALRNDEIIKMTKYLGAVYRSELAINLQKMGYQLRNEGKGFFELAHITQKQIDGFSKRSNQIEELLAKQGLNRSTATLQQKQRATMQTRSAKVATARDEILKEWQATSKELNINFDYKSYKTKESDGASVNKLARDKYVGIELSSATRAEAAKRAVKFAINHLGERESIIKEGELLAVAMKKALGSARLSDIEIELHNQLKKGHLIKEAQVYRPADQTEQESIKTNQAKNTKAWIAELLATGSSSYMTKTKARNYVKEAIKHGELVKSEARYTTQTALTREKKILQIECAGRKALEPIMAENIAKKQLALTNLNQGQRQAALLMTTTTNRVVGIQGFAGTGKSHMLETAQKMIEENGYRIQALAPYGSQVKALSLLGIEAKTLASFLRSKDQYKDRNKNINNRTVIIIDEAGVIPTRQMEQALMLIEKSNARAVLLGDIAQTKAIEAGKPFDQLQKAGMAIAYMEEIVRQEQSRLKEAVELAAKGDTTASLQLISNVIEIKDEKERLNSIVKDYMALPQNDRDKTIIVSGTNEARRYINNKIRIQLRGLNQLETKDITLNTLTTKDATTAERKYSENYSIGDIISPEKDYPKIGIKAGEFYEVIEKGESGRNGLTVRPINELKREHKQNSETIEFSPMVYKKLRIYQPNSSELAAGDHVRITKNDPPLNLTNGERMKVKEINAKECYIILTRSSDEADKSKDKTSASNKIKNHEIKLSTNKPLHIDYAYATTIHSSQGLTSERV